MMNITYNDTRKDLPYNRLSELFRLVGWWVDDKSHSQDEEKAIEKGFMQVWIHSTLVVSAWDGDRLVGAVRVLSDTIFRSIIYDLLVDPAYQGKGIGRGLVLKCKEHFPDSEWLVGCDKKNSEFYKKLGFVETLKTGEFLVIPCKLF